MKLISMTKFTLEKYEEHKFKSDTSFFNQIINYAKFLNQELTTEMFIGVNPLFKDFKIKESNGVDLTKSIVCKDVLHLFWWNTEHEKWMLSRGLSTIESCVNLGLELSETSIEQIGCEAII